MKTKVNLTVIEYIVHYFWHAVFSSYALWPPGEYGLPMPKSGCPGANDFTWTTGYIIQDLQDGSSSKTNISSNSNLQAIVTNDVQQYFCIKSNQTTVSDAKRKPWPAGEYCIYQKGKSCPAGMSSGSVFWDDENANGNNKNAKNGSLPEGVFNEDTKIFFCCQTNGVHSTPIKLPVNKPFYLIAVGPYCQLVLNTVYTLEYIEYDTEDDNNHDKVTSPHPFGANLVHPRIYYCYYQGTPAFLILAINSSQFLTIFYHCNQLVIFDLLLMNHFCELVHRISFLDILACYSKETVCNESVIFDLIYFNVV